MEHYNSQTVENTFIHIEDVHFRNFIEQITRKLMREFEIVNISDASSLITDAILAYREKYFAKQIIRNYSMGAAARYIFTTASREYIKKLKIKKRLYEITNEKKKVVDLSKTLPLNLDFDNLGEVDILLQNIFDKTNITKKSKTFDNDKTFDITKFFEERVEIAKVFRGKEQQKTALLCKIKHLDKKEYELADLLNIPYDNFRQNLNRGRKTIIEHIKNNPGFWEVFIKS